MEFKPEWVGAGIGLVGALLAIGGAWAVMRYQVKDLKRTHRKLEIRQDRQDNDVIDLRGQIDQFEAVLNDAGRRLEKAIREEFEKARKTIDKRLFGTDGIPYYVHAGKCLEARQECRQKIEKMEDRYGELSKELEAVKARVT